MSGCEVSSVETGKAVSVDRDGVGKLPSVAFLHRDNRAHRGHQRRRPCCTAYGGYSAEVALDNANQIRSELWTRSVPRSGSACQRPRPPYCFCSRSYSFDVPSEAPIEAPSVELFEQNWKFVDRERPAQNTRFTFYSLMRCCSP